jgi:hypothetical protein
MDKVGKAGTERLRRAGRSHRRLAPIVWIVILLASWLLIVEWRDLPELVSATMAALS